MPEVVLRFPEGRYEGEVDGNNIPDGQGLLEFPGNDELERQLYEGGFKAKKADGKGILRWTQGDKYEGDFENGLRHGKGSYLSKVHIRPWKDHFKSDFRSDQIKGPCHVSGIFLPLRVKSLPLATIYEVKIPLRKWKKSLLQRNPAQMTSAIIIFSDQDHFLPQMSPF
jgi:hypothetical protein